MKTRVTVTMDDELLTLARRHARVNGQSLSQLLEALVDENLEREVEFERSLATPCLEKEWFEAKAERRAWRTHRL